MSDAPKDEAQPAAPSGPSKLPLILALVSTLATAGVLGLVVYTRVLFKRPAITEQSERERLAKTPAAPVAAPVPGMMVFEPISVNISPTAEGAHPNKLHSARITFSLELRDVRLKDRIEVIRPVLIDRIIALVGKQRFADLITVQGRYVLRTQILDAANELAFQELKGMKDVPVTNVFFSDFVVQ